MNYYLVRLTEVGQLAMTNSSNITEEEEMLASSFEFELERAGFGFI